jgi:hypothetical protein
MLHCDRTLTLKLDCHVRDLALLASLCGVGSVPVLQPAPGVAELCVCAQEADAARTLQAQGTIAELQRQLVSGTRRAQHPFCLRCVLRVYCVRTSLLFERCVLCGHCDRELTLKLDCRVRDRALVES